MSTPDDVKDLFGQLTTTYPPILGQPTDDDVKRLRESLTNLLQSINIAGGTDSLSGLIDNATDYLAVYYMVIPSTRCSSPWPPTTPTSPLTPPIWFG
jgi:hypothetical protein